MLHLIAGYHIHFETLHGRVVLNLPILGCIARSPPLYMRTLIALGRDTKSSFTQSSRGFFIKHSVRGFILSKGICHHPFWVVASIVEVLLRIPADLCSGAIQQY